MNRGGTLKVTYTVAASEANPKVALASIQADPLKTAATTVRGPNGQMWTLSDLYIASGASVTSDPVLVIKRNGDPVFTSPNINALEVDNPSRPFGLGNNEIVFMGGDELTIEIITTVDNDGTADSVVVKIPYGVDPA